MTFFRAAQASAKRRLEPRWLHSSRRRSRSASRQTKPGFRHVANALQRGLHFRLLLLQHLARRHPSERRIGGATNITVRENG